MDLQVGGSSRFTVLSNGSFTSPSTGTMNALRLGNFFALTSSTSGVVTLYNQSTNDFNRLQFGGTTSAFPSLKRNGTNLESRLADDNGFAGFTASNLNSSGNLYFGNFQNSFRSNSSGVVQIQNSSENDFSRLQLGGSTNAFPAIKRNAAGIDFRLADDSAFCAVNTTTYRLGDTANTITKNIPIDGINILGFGAVSLGSFGFQHSVLAKANCFGVGVGTSILASAALQVDSTTKGFLPPRMTTTEVNAIASPATGLVVYSTTENQLCLYNGTAWRKLNDSPL
jgi:hypothetical protein